MRDSFVTAKFVLDLSKVQTSYVEENPRFSDRFFTKYSLPFEFYLDRDLRNRIGHYDNLNATNLAKKYDGYHVFEGRVKQGSLEILEVEGSLVRAQIDSGFEELPNFDKKLSELPFEQISVNNIYSHANEICTKGYPHVNYNFPRIIYDKNSPDEPGWKVFNQFLNDRDENGFIDNNEDGSDWDEKPESERTDADQFHKNRNIIHPMPYVLHILKLGFGDAGYELKGDILSDSDLLQRVIFHPNANYFPSNVEDGIKLSLKSKDFYRSDFVTDKISLCYYRKTVDLDLGKYLIQGHVNIDYEFFFSVQKVKVKINGVNVYSKKFYGNTTEQLFFPVDVLEEKGVVEFEVVKFTKNDAEEEFSVLSIDNRENVNQDGSKIRLINNRNSFRLSEFVPNMTFGELVKTIKTWKNCDIDVKGNSIVMNYLTTESVKGMKDISFFEVSDPIKTFVKKRSFNILFPELEEATLNSAYIDIDGVKLGGAQKEETTEVQINGYCLPLETHKGITTAAIKTEDESVLALIYYDGLSNGQNFAKNPAGLMFPDILSVLLPWYKMRITSNEFRWSFYAKKNKWRHIGIKDTLYVYGHKVWIKEITKTVIDETLYQIEIAVEDIS